MLLDRRWHDLLFGFGLALIASLIRLYAYSGLPLGWLFRTYMIHVIAISISAQYRGTAAALMAVLTSVAGIWLVTKIDYTISIFVLAGVFLAIFGGRYSNATRRLEQALQERDAALLEERRASELLRRERVLRGLLTTCAHCKRIRDEQGRWVQADVYITRRSEAKFSHGLCPKCLPLYSE